MTQVKNGDTVKIHYTGTLADGAIFDSSTGHDPLEFTIGSGQVIVGFDEAVTGMEVGEKKNVTIAVGKAYGQRNEEMVIEVPRDQIPPEINPEVGQKLEMDNPDGQSMVVKIIEVTDERIVLDANPPLAGKELQFDIELVSVS
jgi:peptidylprolyl isomerase